MQYDMDWERDHAVANAQQQLAENTEKWKRELADAGWLPVSRTIWKSPSGTLFGGPFTAWKHMTEHRDYPESVHCCCTTPPVSFENSGGYCVPPRYVNDLYLHSYFPTLAGYLYPRGWLSSLLSFVGLH